MNELQFQFEWDEKKAAGNVGKHGCSFELACTVFRDPRLLTVADVEHSATEDRWFSLGLAADGSLLAVVYLWSEAELGTIRIRVISARRTMASEQRQYQELT